MKSRFFNIQYAVWALDIEMSDVFRKYLDNRSAALQIKALESEQGHHRVYRQWCTTELTNKMGTYTRNYQNGMVYNVVHIAHLK